MTRTLSTIVAISSILILFIFIFYYAYFRTKDIVRGVSIDTVNIVNGETYTDSYLPITGTAKNAAVISLDGREITVSQSGEFADALLLLPGYNIVSLSAKDRYGHEVSKNYQVYYKLI
jgi:hypothetical protein